jgi:hypothetical protein
MFSQKGGESPLAEKRFLYSFIKRGRLERRCYSESTCVKKRVYAGQQSSTYERPSTVKTVAEHRTTHLLEAH